MKKQNAFNKNKFARVYVLIITYMYLKNIPRKTRSMPNLAISLAKFDDILMI